MIEQLEQLRKADQETWERINRWELNFAHPEEVFLTRAIVQAVLQEAITGRKWLYEQTTFTARPSAKIWNPDWQIDHYICRPGDSPAEALLEAYLETIKGARQ